MDWQDGAKRASRSSLVTDDMLKHYHDKGADLPSTADDDANDSADVIIASDMSM